MSILVVGSALVVVAAGFGERREMSRAEQSRAGEGGERDGNRGVLRRGLYEGQVVG